MSAATDSGLVHPTVSSMSIERSPVDRLLLEPSSGKSLDVRILLLIRKFQVPILDFYRILLLVVNYLLVLFLGKLLLLRKKTVSESKKLIMFQSLVLEGKGTHSPSRSCWRRKI